MNPIQYLEKEIVLGWYNYRELPMPEVTNFRRRRSPQPKRRTCVLPIHIFWSWVTYSPE